jgi:hypothetical protein
MQAVVNVHIARWRPRFRVLRAGFIPRFLRDFDGFGELFANALTKHSCPVTASLLY